MFTTQKYLNASQRAVCLALSMLIVSFGLALGAFGIDSMVQNAAATQITSLMVHA